MIASVNPTEVGALITGSAAFAGVVAGGSITWLTTWTTGRRQRADARNGSRHASYAAFIGAAEELTRLLIAHDTMENPPVPDSNFGENLGRAVGSVDRAYVGVLLVGPEKAQTGAAAVRQEAWRVLNWLRTQGRSPKPGSTIEELGALAGNYAMVCEVFAGIARDVIGNS
jgi:hypothetical protein